MIELVKKQLRQHRRFVTFCAVGASGVLVNLGVFLSVLWLFEERDMQGWWIDNLSVFLGWAVSVSSNFTLNDRLTFQTEAAYQDTWRVRLTQYYVSAFAAFLIQWGVFNALMWLTEGIGAGDSSALPSTLEWLYRLLLDFRRVSANLVGIGVATIANYLLAKHWVFRAEDR